MDRPVLVATRRIDLSSEIPFSLGHARVEPRAHEIEIDGERTRLQPQTLKVLIALHDRVGEVVTRDELIERCWDGRIVGEDVINRCISLLRRLSKAANFRIETVPRAGYRLAVGEPGATRFARWKIATAAALVAVVGAVLLITVEWTRRQGNPPMPTIALLPFAGGETNSKVRELADSTRASLAHTLSEGGFPITLVSTGDAATKSADLVLSGNVSEDSGHATVHVGIQDAGAGALIYSQELGAQGADVAVLPERVGAQVAAVLSWTGALMALDRGHISNPQDRVELLRNIALTIRGIGNLLDSYKIARRVAPREPGSAFAQLSLAMDTGMALGELPAEDRHDAVATARRAADAAKTLAPDFGDTYVPPCLLHSPIRRAECEQSLREGLRADPDAPFVAFFLSAEMNEVGRSAEALSLARLSLANDRYKLWKIARALRALETQGQSYEAEKLFIAANRWWPKSEELAWSRWFGMLSAGNWPEIEAFERNIDLTVFPPEDREPAGFLEAVRARDRQSVSKVCARRWQGLALTCMIALQQLGDLDGAFAIADKIYPELRGRTPGEEEGRWFANLDKGLWDLLSAPSAAPMRRDPRFLPIAARVGLLDYWRRVHLPDFCTVRQEAVCKVIRRR